MSNIASANMVAEVASLIGDVARANILLALMDGRALTAGELAWAAGVSASTTSGHLARLAQSRLVMQEKQGRHRYYRLASAQVAEALEALMALTAGSPPRHRPAGPRDAALRLARTCYDHLAGRLGTSLADVLQARGHVVLDEEGAGRLTGSGEAFLASFGIHLGPAAPHGRPLCRTCLDWSERRPHLRGRLGAALCARCFDLGWVTRTDQARALAITPAGYRGLADVFGITLT